MEQKVLVIGEGKVIMPNKITADMSELGMSKTMNMKEAAGVTPAQFDISK